MTTSTPLPPGQIARASFPRFGMIPFAHRFPKEAARIQLRISGDVRAPVTLESELGRLPRVEQCSDFHCVTTWTCRSLTWSGFRFADFYHQLVVPLAEPVPDAAFVVLRGQDGYRSGLLLADLLADDVLLADRLQGEPLTIAHGAPLRLVAPAHYGYKSVKHVHRIEIWRSDAGYRSPGPSFLTHPRARVALEERGRWFPGWFLRHLYRPLIRPVAARFARALERYRAPGEQNG